LERSTHQADTAVEECTCFQDCTADTATDCPLAGQWHSHADEPCPVHPDTIALV